MEEDVKIIDSKIGAKPLVVIHNETTEIVVGQPKAQDAVQWLHFKFFCYSTRISRMESKV